MAQCSYAGAASTLLALICGMALPAVARAQCVGQWLPPETLPTIDGDDNGIEIDSTIMWDPDGSGPLPPVLVAAGIFTSAGSTSAHSIAYWDGASWNPLGPGFDDGAVLTLATTTSGDLIAAGNFTTSGGATVNHIARWHAGASTWAPLGDGLSDQVFAVTVMPNGDVIAGGIFTAAILTTPAINRIARWDGSSWSGLGTGVTTGGSYVTSLAVMPNGDLVAGGARFTSVGGVSASRIARWNPATSTWSALGTGLAAATTLGVNSLKVMPNGDLIVGGGFTAAGGVSGTAHIARWNGSAWLALGVGLKGSGFGASGSALALALMPNGDLIAGGSFSAAGNVAAGDVPASFVARWNGTAWTALNDAAPDSNVTALTVEPSGVLAVGGAFTFVGDALSPFLAEYADCSGVCCASDGSCTAAAPGSPSATCSSGVLIVNGSCEPNTCSVQPPSGVCCRGSTCNASVQQIDCTPSGAAGAAFFSSAVDCNAGGNTSTSCCYGDYNKSSGVTVQDIFAFLADWFAGSPYARVGGDGTPGPLTVQNIFDFLSAWFAGGC